VSLVHLFLFCGDLFVLRMHLEMGGLRMHDLVFENVEGSWSLCDYMFPCEILMTLIRVDGDGHFSLSHIFNLGIES
jgi:hypothetical protein